MPPKTKIEPVLTRKNLEIRWPHVIRVEHRLKYFLDLDWSKLSPLTLSAENTPTVVEVAPTIEGHADFSKITQLDLQRLADENRMQRSKLQASVQLQNKLGSNWEGDAGSHIGQLMTLLDRFIESDKLDVRVPKTEDADLFRRVLIATNIQRIVEHIGQFIKSSSKEDPIAVFDNVRPIRSTASSPVWYTAKPTQPVQKSQISHIVMDSGWESVGFEFERDRIPGLLSWAKNDHLGFEIYYLWQGKVHAYFPDFLLCFEDNRYVIMEVKGQKKEQDKAKWAAAEEWVRAVNAHGGFGKWEFKALEDPKDIFNLV
jgi:type III restriction enzyme